MEKPKVQISQVVLQQVQKDGKTYVQLAKDMATVILEGLAPTGADIIEFVSYGTHHDLEDADLRRTVKDMQAAGIVVYYEGIHGGRVFHSSVINGLDKAYITCMYKWPTIE